VTGQDRGERLHATKASEGRGSSARERPALSVVVPVYNEEENVQPLVAAIRNALAYTDSWELLLVDDGSTDATVAVAEGLAAQDRRIRVLKLARNYGQTAAMQAGFDHSRGAVVVTMDGDLQNDPADIPRLVARLEEGFDLVAGYRERRQDKVLTRKIPSWIANRLIRRVTGIPIRDNGCSLKAYRRELVDRLHLYADLHRFIPAMAAVTAGARITEIPVRHHPRRHGRSKYGLSRTVKVMLDLITVKTIQEVRERPLQLFGVGALGAFLFGIAFAAAAVVAHASFVVQKAQAVVFPGVSLLWFGLAFYLLMLGLIAEAALREELPSGHRSKPVVREVGGR
jgi:glycosyltransferase involved in cell wall biosynthesis